MLRRMFGAVACSAAAHFAVAMGSASAALADFGHPVDGQMVLQSPATPIMEHIVQLYGVVNIAIIAITIFVMLLMLYVMYRFSEKNNPTPSRNAHHTLLEVAWTIIPILILVGLSIPSFRLLYEQYSFPKPDLTIKAIGNQWFWSYEYPDQEGVAFDSFMLSDEDREKRKAGGELLPRLLAVDNEVVVPVDAVVHVLVTARDVIHNWTVQPFGSKVDAVPGRVTSTWFKVREKGVYYGQCSELCGKDHAFMPIAVRVVDKAVFDQWVALRKAGGADVDEKARALVRSASAADASTATVASAD